tara:strand:+ start:181 stop:558 length:378 start_codon:yes stop_codon:yes gene_type:complete
MEMIIDNVDIQDMPSDGLDGFLESIRAQKRIQKMHVKRQFEKKFKFEFGQEIVYDDHNLLIIGFYSPKTGPIGVVSEGIEAFLFPPNSDSLYQNKAYIARDSQGRDYVMKKEFIEKKYQVKRAFL